MVKMGESNMNMKAVGDRAKEGCYGITVFEHIMELLS